MDSKVFVRVNGRGNAWPAFLGGESKFYNKESSEDLSNASFSLIQTNSEDFDLDNISSEILIDAGHHTVPFLIKNGNRLPEAMVLTHGHMDHTLGIDWVAHSYKHIKGQKLVLYASEPVWNFVVQSYPHLPTLIEFKELLPGVENVITEVDNCKLTMYPVYHGESAVGASMLHFTFDRGESVVFTGDMLCPLLRENDYKSISKASHIFIDSNNRYPYPKSNHGSICGGTPENMHSNPLLEEWFKKVTLNYLITPHARRKFNESLHTYFEQFLNDFCSVQQLPCTIMELAEKVNVKNFQLIHFGGREDRVHYKQQPLNTRELQHWTREIAKQKGLEVQFNVPETGDIYRLDSSFHKY